MERNSENPSLNRFAAFTACCTLLLICAGGLVTSKGAGLAVPDWPNTYGYNMFFFPISRWVGNVFYEHTHRLIASGVGLLTVILAVWLWAKEERAWLRKLGFVALVAVIVQGVLGGLRVTMLKNEIGIFHASLAQLFFVLTCCITLFTSRYWVFWSPNPSEAELARSSRWPLVGLAVLIFVQLAIGATMRHQHAGLAIPDFPLAYGKVWPQLDASAIAEYNRKRIETVGYNPITAFQIVLQMVHRCLAVLIVIGVYHVFRSATGKLKGLKPFPTFGRILLALVITQFSLGAATVWTGKSADIATAHVAVGALTLATTSLLAVLAFGASRFTDQTTSDS